MQNSREKLKLPPKHPWKGYHHSGQEELEYNVQNICSRYNKNLAYLFGDGKPLINQHLKQKVIDHTTILRYEDMALHPEEFTRRLFEYLKIDYNTRVDMFLKLHSNVSMSEIKKAEKKSHGHQENRRQHELLNKFSTLRNSKESAFQWVLKTEIPWNFIEEIQQVCSQSLEYFKYKNIASEKEYKLYHRNKGKILPISSFHGIPV